MNAPSPKTFRRQFFEMMTGSTLAQVLSLLLMPVISRLYGPPEMGEYGLYVSISSIFSIMANLRLDMAVVLGKDDDEGARLVWMGMVFSVLFGLLAFLLLISFSYTPYCPWRSPTFIPLTAISVTFLGSIQSLLYWHSRQRRYHVLSTRNVLEKALVLTLGIGLGLNAFTSVGLVVSQTVGYAVSLFYAFAVARLPPPRFAREVWRRTFRDFVDFPKKYLPSSLLLILAQQMPALLFASFFSISDVGYYNLVARLFEIPINLIGYTFSVVYYQHASRKSLAERRQLFWRSLRMLSALTIPPLIVGSLWGPSLFQTVFGPEWAESGRLIVWLSPFTLVRLLFVSQSGLLLVQRRLNMDLLISLSLFLAQAIGFVLGDFYFGTLHAAVACMSLLGTCVYSCGLFLIYKVIQGAKE